MTSGQSVQLGSWQYPMRVGVQCCASARPDQMSWQLAGSVEDQLKSGAIWLHCVWQLNRERGTLALFTFNLNCTSVAYDNGLGY